MQTAKASEDVKSTSPQLQRSSSPTKPTTPDSPPSKSRRLRKDSLENLDDDPWGSPALHKNHTHTVHNEATPSSNPTAAKPLRNAPIEPSRTTSAFTTHSGDPISGTSPMATEPSVDGGGGGWDSEAPSHHGFPNAQQGLGGGGFSSGATEQGTGTNGNLGRSLGGGRVHNRGVEETVTVTLLPEKEGMFMFQHHNYEVKCTRKASSVIRRYSDFVWLLDCLHKRYPFRQLPLLPPKRVAGRSESLVHAYYANSYVSQWATSISRRDVHGEASTRSRKVCKRARQTSSLKSRTTCGHVFDRAHCKCTFPSTTCSLNS